MLLFPLLGPPLVYLNMGFKSLCLGVPWMLNRHINKMTIWMVSRFPIFKERRIGKYCGLVFFLFRYWIEPPWASCMLGWCCTTELHPHLWACAWSKIFFYSEIRLHKKILSSDDRFGLVFSRHVAWEIMFEDLGLPSDHISVMALITSSAIWII